MEAEKLKVLKQRKKHRLAKGVVQRNALWAATTGFVPIPVVDSAATVAVQLKMLAELSDVYGVAFNKSSGKSVIAAMTACITSSVLGRALLGTGIFANIAKVMPVVGSTLSIVTMPGFNAAFTYALGRVFQQHYEAGGTMENFDPDKAAPEFRRNFKDGLKFDQKREAV
ncbi:YcjF family protein [Thalassospira sp.]|uniref:YcjF family protein n=1 Tax=Thalassospira sp. TaxID=1912094 RepID=UPI003AA927FF